MNIEYIFRLIIPFLIPLLFVFVGALVVLQTKFLFMVIVGWLVAALGVFMIFLMVATDFKEVNVRAKVVMISPEVNKLEAFFVGYNFSAFDGKDTLKVGTTKEAKTIKLNDTILVKKMIISSKFSKGVDSIRYTY